MKKYLLMHFFLVISLSIILSSTSNALDMSFCRCRSQMTSGRIVGGSFGSSQSVPWLVSIGASIDEANEGFLYHLMRYGIKFALNSDQIKLAKGHNCGGVILNENWVLTAAHCVSKKNEIFVSTIKSDNLFEILEAPRIKVVEVHEHPFFIELDNMPNNRDLALIKLETPLNFTQSNLEPACLWLHSTYPKNARYSLYGWGATKPSFKKDLKWKHHLPSPKLKMINTIEVTSLYSVCHLRKDILCMKDIDNKSSSVCVGDSGSPMHFVSKGSSYVVGVASCSFQKILKNELVACNDLMAISNLHNMRDWILEKVGSNDICPVSPID